MVYTLVEVIFIINFSNYSSSGIIKAMIVLPYLRSLQENDFSISFADITKSGALLTELSFECQYYPDYLSLRLNIIITVVGQNNTT